MIERYAVIAAPSNGPERETIESAAREPVSRGRGRPVLFLDARVPQPSRDAASLRSSQVLTWLAARAPVDLMALAGTFTENYVEALNRLGIRLLGAGDADAIRLHLAREGSRYGVIVLAWSEVAAAFLETARTCAPDARIVFDTHDVNHVREYRHARATGNRGLLRRALEIKQNEIVAIRAADRTIAITDTDRATLTALVPEATIATAGIWIDPEPPPPSRTEPVVLFVGHYLADTNKDAAVLLAREIMPLVWRERPDARLELAGSMPFPALANLVETRIGIPGWEADLRPRFRRAALFAAPLRFGSGLKGKMLQAAAHRLPLVAGAVAVEGIGLIADRDYLHAETPADYAAAILRLFNDPELAADLANSAFGVVLERFSRATVERQFAAIFDEFLVS